MSGYLVIVLMAIAIFFYFLFLSLLLARLERFHPTKFREFGKPSLLRPHGTIDAIVFSMKTVRGDQSTQDPALGTFSTLAMLSFGVFFLLFLFFAAVVAQ